MRCTSLHAFVNLAEVNYQAQAISSRNEGFHLDGHQWRIRNWTRRINLRHRSCLWEISVHLHCWLLKYFCVHAVRHIGSYSWKFLAGVDFLWNYQAKLSDEIEYRYRLFIQHLITDFAAFCAMWFHKKTRSRPRPHVYSLEMVSTLETNKRAWFLETKSLNWLTEVWITNVTMHTGHTKKQEAHSMTSLVFGEDSLLFLAPGWGLPRKPDMTSFWTFLCVELWMLINRSIFLKFNLRLIDK